MQPGRRPHTDIFPAFTEFHSILAFIVPVLVNFIEVKYQGGVLADCTVEGRAHFCLVRSWMCALYRNRQLFHVDTAANCPKGCWRPAHLGKGNTSREETYVQRVG
ncbi:hypothetical protein EUGRSUZ_H01409 [Eucalyptus grandis]|uniref:Uncharacterized protein n=2 Tax=Eucalyptus grandis TaxID=71139 RepID=A0ACC3JPM5_EUCGR|nr:hypothetical protein EUGRSUZ_H01409 [Eucalyptus grandis]